MIEARIISHLASLTALPVYAERPQTPDPEYILIERTGAGVENRIRRVTIAVQSYAESLYRAAEINGLVETAMDALTDLENISKCKLNSSYNFTDTETRSYRYQAVFDIIFMEGEE